MANQIGQYQFSKRTDCIANGNGEGNAASIENSKIGIDNSSYVDKVLKYNNGTYFISSQDYYCSFDVVKNINYEMNFTIYLIKHLSDGSVGNNYQYIRKVTVPIATNSVKNKYVVVMYDPKYDEEGNEYTDDNPYMGTPLVCFPQNKNRFKDGEKDENGQYKIKLNQLYFYIDDINDSEISDDLINSDDDILSNVTYYIGDNNGNAVKTLDYNDNYIVATWRDSQAEDEVVHFEFGFRPVEDKTFNAVLVQMNRTTLDMNIIQSDPDDSTGDTTILGRIATIKKGTIYELKNLLSTAFFNNADQTLSKIGVWGRYGLPMMINGEEIKIGPSGYYELEDITIESLAVYPSDNSDFFTIDYIYQEGSEEE